MAKGPKRIAAPKMDTGLSDLAQTLEHISKTAKKNRAAATGIRRASKNPSKVGVDASLRVTRGSRRPPAPTVPGQAYQDVVLGGSDAPVVDSGNLIEVDGELIPDRSEYLSPPPSIDPDRPRAREARYNPDTRQLHVVFREGGTYVYYDVPTTTWRALKRNRSFGQTLDRLVINQYPYEKVAF